MINDFQKWCRGRSFEEIHKDGTEQERKRILNELAKWAMKYLDILEMEQMDYFIKDQIEKR